MALLLEWSNEQDQLEITPELISMIEELLQIAGKREDIPLGEVALSFVTDEEIRKLNKEYRGLDKPTDVLSFPMMEFGAGELEINYGELEEIASDEDTLGGSLFGADQLGDIIISVPRAIEQAGEYGHSINREIGFLFVHGFLHLIGYDHQTEDEEKRMFRKQEEILQEAGLIR
ncbi:Probable rRNA maturation factor [Chlamydia abortus]|uniref:rRNA maturation RNase YbeY n=1 Tax=unclassified Paenibacillus TaxID=185978 RepID=UPI000A27DF3E|nr:MULTISPECIES: rRNA maturation RNase YbeY [Paenibacillaceae]SHE10402.1 Probable rRNA maturation factor [Chlamydia abortus]